MRRLVFQNLAIGVPVEQIMADFQLSQLEVDHIRRHVGRKLCGHRVLDRQAPIACDNVRDIRANRRALLGVLARLGNLDLSSDLILITDKAGVVTGSFGKIVTQSIDHPEMIDGANHKMSEHRAKHSNKYAR